MYNIIGMGIYDMKLRGLLIVCLLGIVFALMTAPVSAASASSAILGSIPQAVSISVTNPAAGTLNPGATATFSPTITATSNTGFGITVADQTGRAASYLGNMSAVTLAAPTVYMGTASSLMTPISVAGTAQTAPVINAYTVGGTTSRISATPQTIYDSTSAISSYPLPLTISQPVLTTDVVLPTTQEYRIDLTFIITSA
jgi:hypothetical protein